MLQKMKNEGPVLPVHPKECKTCAGTDWDLEHDVPCCDKSWCQEFVGSKEEGWYVRELSKNHAGTHKSGAFEWKQEKSSTEK